MKLHTLCIFVLVFSIFGCKQLRSSSPPIELTARQLLSDYNENALSADEKYSGKTLIVTGNISHFAQLQNTVGVYLKDNNAANQWFIICFIDKSSQPDIYSKLKEGETGTFIGMLERDKDGKIIFLSDCKI